MPPLIDVFWHHVDRRISSKPRGRRELERELKRLSKGRNKNTYTNWFKEPRAVGEPRPNIRLSDLEDVATALNVPPDALIAPVTADKSSSALQLELPFGPDVRRVSVELEATDSALLVRIERSR
jgi:hypothetical protein